MRIIMVIHDRPRCSVTQSDSKRWRRLLRLCPAGGILLAAFPSRSDALGDPRYVGRRAVANGFRLADGGAAHRQFF